MSRRLPLGVADANGGWADCTLLIIGCESAVLAFDYSGNANADFHYDFCQSGTPLG